MAKRDRNGLFGGLILLAVGLVALTGQFVDFSQIDSIGFLFLPALGALFMLWGVLAREAGPMVPGGILSGIGWGAYLVSGPGAGWLDVGQGEEIGGAFMLTFALGWAAITVFSVIFAREKQWWALIPAAIIGLIGSALLFGGVMMDALDLVEQLWPVALIVVGAYVLLKAMRQPAKTEPVAQIES